MISKEAFAKIKQSKVIWTIPELQYFEQIEKDLEVLEILKKQITVIENREDTGFGNYITFHNLKINTKGLSWEQFNKIKEWLEHESNK